MKRLMLSTLLLLITLRSCHGQCSNVSSSFRTNLKTLLDLLNKTAPLRNGFYETSVGNKSDQVYGVVQCKANISSNDCANCLKSYTESSDGCPESTGMATLSTFCTMKFSDENFFGVWDNFSSASFGDNGLDNPLVFSKGYLMMQGLASTVPDQPLMYQATDVDVGEDGKRYGLAQCSRDLSKLNCQNCLEDRLVNYRSFVENRTGWEILGISCSMWYSNVSGAYSPGVTAFTPSQSLLPPGSPTVTSGAQRGNGGRGIYANICIVIITFTGLLAIHAFKMS
ncbi:hypothetical protein L2E82_31310 [Cichorium intybus]|uniref:Uncharacterized protein n=1 Tax=Cichorium intybus TaxID=13427 RepID=A0ACB9D2U9_CICIN|nr:hypothetical protein L2E82_31310 [Cichorium intybus]